MTDQISTRSSHPNPKLTQTMSPNGKRQFTSEAEEVLVRARSESVRLHHSYIGTEHVLLGLVQLHQGAVGKVLYNFGLDLETLRIAVKNQVGPGPSASSEIDRLTTPRARKILVMATNEAKALNHSNVDPEHILLAILRENAGSGVRSLRSIGVDLELMRNELLHELATK